MKRKYPILPSGGIKNMLTPSYDTGSTAPSRYTQFQLYMYWRNDKYSIKKIVRFTTRNQLYAILGALKQKST